MGFNPPVPQRDSDWEIRAAVLLSLLFQVLLIFVGATRKRTANPLPRFVSWSCYLLADWVADLALGLLVNNLGNIGGNNTSSSSNPDIFAFWTPFLLLHLGGQDTITAYSIEDNELWLRHFIGLLFELFAACVIFSCSLHSNPMIPATVLMFVVGIIKYGERTYSIYSGSVDGVLANLLPPANPGLDYAKLMTVFSGKEKAGLVVEVVNANGVALDAVRARERTDVDWLVRGLEDRSLEVQAHALFVIFRRVCYDINLSQKARKISQAYFLDNENMRASRVFELIEVELSFVYDMVHTKEPIAHTMVGCILRFVGSACIVSSAVAFFHLDKESIRRADVGITYALVLGGLALDMAALARLIFSSNWTLVFIEKFPRLRLRWLAGAIRCWRPRQRLWSEMTSQLSLISYCLDKHGRGEEGSTIAGHRLWRNPSVVGALSKVADKLGMRELFDDLFFIRRETLRSNEEMSKEGEPLRSKEGEILKFIFEQLKDTAKKVRNSTYEEMRKACSYRGERAIKDMREERLKMKSTQGDGDTLMDSVIKWEFDESLLMWHIATDLCFVGSEDQASGSQSTIDSRKHVSKTLSEYMLYLLVKQPMILAPSAGVGQKVYRDSCAEARRFFESKAVWNPDKEGARTMLLGTNTSIDPMEVKGSRSRSVLFHACILSKELMKLDENERWELVARVWVEMLTYAAAKCKGTTHVRQLARGGELITMVWLLIAHMGIGDTYQKEPEEDATPKIILHDQ